MSRLMFCAVLLAAVIAGCGAPATNDPYVLTSNALDASWSRVQIDVSLRAQIAGESVSLERGALRLAMDVESGKALFTLSIDARDFGLEPAELPFLGLRDPRIEVDVLFDGEAVYARSPLAAEFLPMLLGEFGEAAQEDYAGWLRLGSREEFEVLAALASMSQPQPEVAPQLAELAAMSPAEIQAWMEGAGVTLSYEGVEQREGVQASHLRMVMDMAKLVQSQQLPGVDPRQLAEIAAAEAVITADAWLNPATSRPVEVSLELTSSDPELEQLSLAVYFSEPDASVTFASPESYVDVPVVSLIQQFMGGFGPGFGP